jgi:hypothetical protein
MMIALLRTVADVAVSPSGLPNTTAGQSSVSTALQIVLGIIAGLALLMITISGLRYVLSAGDPQKAKQAREGIIYSLIGLVVAIMAEAIVTYVVKGLQ